MPIQSKQSNLGNSSIDLENILEESIEYSPATNPKLLETPAPSKEIGEIMKMYNNLSEKYEKLEQELKNEKLKLSSPKAKNKRKVINSRSKDINAFLDSIKKRAQKPLKTREIELEDSFFYGKSQSAVKIDKNKETKILTELEEFDEEEVSDSFSKININIGELASGDKEIQCSIKIGSKAITIKNLKRANLSLEKASPFKCTRIE